jgi:Mn2+/Fe2+ NRAMP family transporter
MNRTTTCKTTIILLIIALLSISFLSVTADTISSQNHIEGYAVRNNNTLSTFEYFSISSGEAVIYASYVGYQNITTRAQTEIKIQKKFLLFWIDVDNGRRIIHGLIQLQDTKDLLHILQVCLQLEITEQ